MCSFTLGKTFLHFSPLYAYFTKKVMKIRNDPLLKRIYFVLMITTANWLVGLLFMLKSTTLFQLEHLKSRSGRSADFAYKLRIHCLTKILNNWFELFDRLGLHSINMLHTVSPEKSREVWGLDCWEAILLKSCLRSLCHWTSHLKSSSSGSWYDRLHHPVETKADFIPLIFWA